MNNYTLIANSGIQFLVFPLEINPEEKFSLLFHEWFDEHEGKWILDLAQELNTEDGTYLYRKKDLFDGGYLASEDILKETSPQELKGDGIEPISTGDGPLQGEIYKMSFSDKNNKLSFLENQWLPLPYFLLRSLTRFRYGPFNWARLKLVPEKKTKSGTMPYTAILAFDTRADMKGNEANEFPVFSDEYTTEMHYALCSQEFMLMDYCSPSDAGGSYVNEYIFNLVHKGIGNVSRLKSRNKLSYIASYYFLIDYIAQKKLFPQVTLYKNFDVPVNDIDMVIDMGNSRTTSILVEDNFNQTEQLALRDFSSMQKGKLIFEQEPFDMRLAFRKVDFGEYGRHESRQFIYPSFVRLGKEANYLMHNTELQEDEQKLSTMSSPKRYLWDDKKSNEEWKFLTLKGETGGYPLFIPGISEYLKSDGSLSDGSSGGRAFHYSRKSLMTFAFLEMLVQATMQVNSEKYRSDHGEQQKPRRIRHMVITCPTAMSVLERHALIQCAKDATVLFSRFYELENKIDIIPVVSPLNSLEKKWYYDEATCSQLVYVYGEVGYKYKGTCKEFFNLYGNLNPVTGKNELIIGSLDIGAGTTDMMISRYSYSEDNITTIRPEPLFYDSFYYAGDDMVNELIKKVIFYSKDSALRKKLCPANELTYRQKLRDFFGPDHAGQTNKARILRRDFNLQYTVPLIYHMMELFSSGENDRTIRYADVFSDCEPNEYIRQGFKQFFGLELESLEWCYRKEEMYDAIALAFEPLLKKIATIMYSCNCDIILLSGRPSSLSPVRDIFLKYYAVSPNRLILLNNYYVGHWYPFGNNTGYIANPKTVVAVGALIGYYSTISGKLDTFRIDVSMLDTNLNSVVNYIESAWNKEDDDYVLSPEKHSGELQVSSLPGYLKVKQLGLASYPSRRLFSIDFDCGFIGDKIRSKARMEGNNLTDMQVMSKINEELERMRLRLPFTLSVERDQDNYERINVISVTDGKGDEIQPKNIHINIQSLNAGDSYWLDNGAFEIQ